MKKFNFMSRKSKPLGREDVSPLIKNSTLPTDGEIQIIIIIMVYNVCLSFCHSSCLFHKQEDRSTFVGINVLF